MKKEQGSALIVALALLSLLTLMAIAFTSNMRLENQSSQMNIERISAKQIAKAGLHDAIGKLIADYEADEAANDMTDNLTESWNTYYSAAVSTDNVIDLDPFSSGRTSKWFYIHENPTDTNSPVIGRYAVFIRDQNGLINLNTAGTDITEVNKQGFGVFEIDLNTVIFNTNSTLNDQAAEYLLDFRYGEDYLGAISSGINEFPGLYLGVGFNEENDDENNFYIYDNDGIDNDADGTPDSGSEGINDPYENLYPALFSNDNRLSSIQEISKIGSVMSSVLDASSTFNASATVHSISSDQHWISAWVPKVNVNHIGKAERLYSYMYSLIGSAAEAYQYSANILDYIDTDDIPHYIGGSDPNDFYLGIEGLRFNEIMSDTSWDVDLENDATSWPSSGSFTDLGTGVHEGFTPDSHTFEWAWDNGTFYIDFQASTQNGAAGAGFDWDVNGVSGTATGNVTVGWVTVSSNKITLTITDNDDLSVDPSLLTDGWTHFDRLKVYPGGDYIEFINIAETDFPQNGNLLDGTWSIFRGGSASEDDRGYLLHDGGGFEFSLNGFDFVQWPYASSGVLPGATPGISYNYLIVAQSLYALDHATAPLDFGAMGGTRDDGLWDTGGAFLSSPSIAANMLELQEWQATENLYLVKTVNNGVTTKRYVVDIAARNSDVNNVEAYANGMIQNLSRNRISPWQSVNDGSSSWDVSGGNSDNTPGYYNTQASNTSSGQDEFWHVRNNHLVSPAELGHVPTGRDPSETLDMTTALRSAMDQSTNSAIYLMAEDADSINAAWTPTSLTGVYSDYDYYTGPNNTTAYTWTWTMDITDANNKIRIENNRTYDVTTYSYVDWNGGVYPGDYVNNDTGETGKINPDGSAYYGTATVANNSISITLKGTGSLPAPNLFYIALSPRYNIEGKINVNTAPEHIIDALAGISTADASNIVAGRPYDEFADLLTILDESELARIQNLITLRSDIYEVVVYAQTINDIDQDGSEGAAGNDYCGDTDSGSDSNIYPSSVVMRAIIDRHPELTDPSTEERYRILSVRYDTDLDVDEKSCP